MLPIEDILKQVGIAPTPTRKLVYRCLMESQAPKSLAEIETELESVDKSTISRTLSILRKHHLLHSLNDGSGSVKYELCHSLDHENQDDTHVHFRCEKCGTTICLTSINVPYVELPEGFIPNEINYIITGICGHCNR